MEKSLVEIKKELETHISDKETFLSLCQTTFKGLQPDMAKQALLEAMFRGWKFDDFLKKNVYAIPFKDAYSLISSIDYARKIGMRSGICGKSAPTFEEKEGKVISCTVTVKRKVEEYVGDYSATVYFSEYNTGRNLWISKPRTMLAKVAEMHALRMACPEELAQVYLEEEYEQDTVKAEIEEENKEKTIAENKTKLESCKNIEELKTVWASLPAEIKSALEETKETLKMKYEVNKDSEPIVKV